MALSTDKKVKFLICPPTVCTTISSSCVMNSPVKLATKVESITQTACIETKEACTTSVEFCEKPNKKTNVPRCVIKGIIQEELEKCAPTIFNKLICEIRAQFITSSYT